jgi:uncharacterized protein (DUF302 family)
MKNRLALAVLLGAFVVAAPVHAAKAKAAAAKPVAAQPAAPAQAGPAVLRIKVEPGVSMEDAAESMRLRGNSLNLKLVAEMPLSKQVEAEVGTPQRTISIFQFCDAVTARDLIQVDVELAIYMPCRIALVENDQGEGTIVMMDIDVEMLAREKKLPPELKARIAKVRASLEEIMRAGAAGEL